MFPTDRTVMKPRPIWQDIPIHCKENVVQYLDYKSRFRLRVCSKRDQNLVDRVPVFLHNLEINVKKNYEDVLYVKDKYGSIHITDNILDHFLNIFKNKKSVANDVVIECNFNVNAGRLDDEEFIIKQLLEKTRSIDYEGKIRAREIYLNIDGLPNIYFFNLFQIFDADYVNSVTLQPTLYQDFYHEIRNSKVWRNAKQIQCHNIQQVPIDSFLHADNLYLRVYNFTADDSWKLIHNFINRENLSIGFGFWIGWVDGPKIEHITSRFNVPPKHKPIMGFNQRRSYTQRFRTKSKDHNFVVNIARNRINGYYCRIKNQDEDFRRFFDLNWKWLRPRFKNINRQRLPPPAPPAPPPPLDYFQYGPFPDSFENLHFDTITELPESSSNSNTQSAQPAQPPIGPDDSLYIQPASESAPGNLTVL